MHSTAALAAAAALLLTTAASAPEPASTLVITGVSIIDTDSGVASEPRDLVIEGGRIVSAAPAGSQPLPAGARRIDGSGRYALPGLIDVHAHVGEGGIAPADDATRDRALRQFLRYGVTTVFVPGAAGAGDADFPGLRARCAATPGACPGLYGTGSLLTAPGSHPVSTIFNLPEDVDPAVVEARGVTMIRPGDDIDALIARKAAAGADAIKIIIEDGPPPWFPKPRLSDEQIRAIVAAAHARGLPVFAHISTAALTRIAVEAGVDGIMHAPTDPLPGDLIALMAERRVWYVPTFALYDGILTWTRAQPESDPYALAGVEPSAIASLADPGFLAHAPESEAMVLGYLVSARSNLVRAHAAGVPIALGSDVNNPFVFPGYSAHEELTEMVRAGLSPAEALRAGTLGAAAFLGAQDRLGRLAPGYEADLILLARNPLQDIANSRSVTAVIADGLVIEDVVGLP